LVEKYTAFGNHWRLEVQANLLAAERILAQEEWAGFNCALRENADPLNGVNPGDNLDQPFSLIANATPEPNDD